VAELAGKVAKLTVFQRTPQWVAQQDNPAYTDEEKAAFAADPSLLAQMYENEKMEMVTLADGAILGGNADARAYLEANVRDNLARVKDPELRRKLTPDYAPGCKRIVISPRFYEAIQDPSCALVTEPIRQVEPTPECARRMVRCTNSTSSSSRLATIRRPISGHLRLTGARRQADRRISG
jgi:cyclohexanone monooxygenase